MWLTQLKIAIAESNVDNISGLLDNVPSFSNAEELTQALYLVKEASKLMNTLQNENRQIKAKIARHIEFIQSTSNKTSSTLDTSH